METVIRLYEWYHPRQPTPEEKIAKASASIKEVERQKRRELLRNEIEREDAEQECIKYAAEGKQYELERATMTQVKLESDEKYIQRELDRIKTNKRTMEKMHHDQIQNRALVDVMDAVTSQSLDPEYVRTVACQYGMNKMNASIVKDIINEALEESDDEESNDMNKLTPSEQARMRELIEHKLNLADTELLNHIPVVGNENLVSILSMSKDELTRKNNTNMRELEAFSRGK